MGRLLADLRQDPGHAPEIGLLYTFWVLRSRLVANSAALQAAGADPAGKPSSPAVPRSSIAKSRLDGAMTGTSFLIATPIGLLSIWLNQVTLVLGIAASAGLDPADPLRIAEFLVVSGLYDSVDEAARVLSSIPSPRDTVTKRPLGTAIAGLAAQVPALLGLGLRRVRSMGLREAITLAVMGVGCVVPVVGIPVFALSSGRETRNLGLEAIEFYGAAQPPPAPAALSIDMEARGWKRPLRIFGVLALALLAGMALATWHWLGSRHGSPAHVALAVVWVWVLLTGTNLVVTVRRAGRPKGRQGQYRPAPALEGSVGSRH